MIKEISIVSNYFFFFWVKERLVLALLWIFEFFFSFGKRKCIRHEQPRNNNNVFRDGNFYRLYVNLPDRNFKEQKNQPCEMGGGVWIFRANVVWAHAAATHRFWKPPWILVAALYAGSFTRNFEIFDTRNLFGLRLRRWVIGDSNLFLLLETIKMGELSWERFFHEKIIWEFLWKIMPDHARS